MRRLASRSTRSSSGTSIYSARLTRSAFRSSAESSAAACGLVRGKPSRIAPRAASGSESRSRKTPAIVSSGTSSPRLMYVSASRPSGLSAATAARRTSPEPRTGRPSRRDRIGACVPFPAPGAPRRTRMVTVPAAPSADEAFVVAHHELRLELLHRLDDDADHDEQARSPEADPAETGDERGHHLRRHGDDAQEQRTGDRDPEHDLREVVLRRSPRSDPWYEP